MPAEGGTIKQLTFHTGKDEMENWGWDSKTIYFTSSRNNNFGSFKTTIEGKLHKSFSITISIILMVWQKLLQENIFSQVLWKVLTRLTVSVTKEKNNPDILGYSPKTNSFKQYTNYEGKDFNPSVDKMVLFILSLMRIIMNTIFIKLKMVKARINSV